MYELYDSMIAERAAT